jgi:hypothetical protein
MHIGQATVTEPITASTEIGMHRLHDLDSFAFGSWHGYPVAWCFHTCGTEPMNTSEGL